MTQSTPVNFVLCWHMHQPWYQQGLDGDYQLPWVYLHAIKDYADMVAHLETHTEMHVVVNFAPVLLEQIDDYVLQLKAWLDGGRKMRDPMLNLLSGVEEIPEDSASRYRLLCDCQRAYAPKMIDPYPVFNQLLRPVRDIFPDHKCTSEEFDFLQYLEPQYFVDVLMWYHLAWLGHSLKQTEISKRLFEKAQHFDQADRRAMLELIHDCLANLIPRYRVLAGRGQLELSMTPYGHPIVPLLNDFKNMKCAQPDAPTPAYDAYPGGKERARWHIQRGIECFEHYFGMRPTGIWFSEGAISEDAIELAEQFDFQWTASGEGVWRNSMRLSGHDPDVDHDRNLFHPYQLKQYKTKLFFRDDGLSDLVGFEYSKRDSIEAADDLIQNLVNIDEHLGKSGRQHVVSVILDGENAWEYYPHNGHYFLDHLYEQLSGHERIRVTCFRDLVDLPMCHELSDLCPGSWVYGSFSTWIGDADKNRAWELLVAAKQAYDQVITDNVLDEADKKQAVRQLAICEGSDWFWWFGDHNPADSVSDFDQLFRSQLKNLYTLLKLPVPDVLDIPVSKGGGQSENAGTMRRNVR